LFKKLKIPLKILKITAQFYKIRLNLSPADDQTCKSTENQLNPFEIPQFTVWNGSLEKKFFLANFIFRSGLASHEIRQLHRLGKRPRRLCHPLANTTARKILISRKKLSENFKVIIFFWDVAFFSLSLWFIID
jgi:hypothetical protein